MLTATTGANPYSATPTGELLRSAARGLIGIDQRFIHALVDDPGKSLPEMLKFASEDHQNDAVDLKPDLIAIFRYLRTPEALPFYLACLQRDREFAEDDLVEALIEQGSAALQPMLDLYGRLEEDESGDIAFALAGLGIRDQRILDLLLDRLEYDPADGAMCLAVYGDPAAIPALEKMRAEVPASESALHRELADAIDDLQNHTVDHSHPHFDLFGRYPEEAGPDFDALNEVERFELLSSESPKVRADAARSFVEQKFSEQTLAKLLELARSDPDPNVRGRAWEGLSGEDDPAVRQELRKTALDPAIPVAERGGALVALARAGEETRELHAAIEAFYDEPGGRARAMEAMWRSFDQTFSKYFPPHLGDPDREILVQAIFGTGYLGIGSEADRLAKYFDHEDLRHDALFAYALSVPAEISRGRVRALFRKIERVAGGLTLGESDLVQVALDQRLLLHGLDPVFFVEGDEAGHAHVHDGEEWAEGEPVAPGAKVGRNDPCPCGSGKKYKKCCGG